MPGYVKSIIYTEGDFILHLSIIKLSYL